MFGRVSSRGFGSIKNREIISCSLRSGSSINIHSSTHNIPAVSISSVSSSVYSSPLLASSSTSFSNFAVITHSRRFGSESRVERRNVGLVKQKLENQKLEDTIAFKEDNSLNEKNLNDFTINTTQIPKMTTDSQKETTPAAPAADGPAVTPTPDNPEGLSKNALKKQKKAAEKAAKSGKAAPTTAKKMIELAPPSGTRDFFPAEMKAQTW
jgi:hypothetical protein